MLRECTLASVDDEEAKASNLLTVESIKLGKAGSGSVDTIALKVNTVFKSLSKNHFLVDMKPE
jgi:hypothetical protein